MKENRRKQINLSALCGVTHVSVRFIVFNLIVHIRIRNGKTMNQKEIM